ncbi:hypothetical protein EV356DRAFT_481390 [Viridothelium virens]|uniref:Uncharacterized protein n=1 Tax=Viridothelium virens TaxID=1048519 RepID=A0A6A6HGG3_VIRVR|nr:hypothetical protein EV356DRAFT_481390 [Viridothelium virens]
MFAAGKELPSAHWTSYEGWDYNGMRKRLEAFMKSINKKAFLEHAEKLFEKNFTISEPFSAGQYWACFELVANDGRLVIARARLPRHPDTPSTVTVEDETYSMQCEAATLKFLSKNVTSIPFPHLYAYAAPKSRSAIQAGAAYMLIEGFYGNTLQDVQFDICQLSTFQQDHIISQWTSIQTELATWTYPQIGSICHVSETGHPTIGKLSSAPYEGLANAGPFTSTSSYLETVGEARLRSITGSEKENQPDFSRDVGASAGDDDDPFIKLGILAFVDIVRNTDLFKGTGSHGPFHFNHMDLGTQNILVDDDFNFLAVIDWEFAQTAPWEINHYPMPFPLIHSDEEISCILSDVDHPACENVSRQTTAQQLYQKRLRDAERKVQNDGKSLQASVAQTLNGPASRIYGCLEKIGVFPGQAERLTREMVRLAFKYNEQDLSRYLGRMSSMLNERPQ